MTGRVIALLGIVAMIAGCGTASKMDSARSPVSDQPNTGAVQCEILKDGAVNNGKLPEGCVKIEGENVRKDGVKVTVAGIDVTFTSWRFKDDGPGESVGFNYTSTEPVCISIKAGSGTFQTSAADTWVNPNGTSGPEASGISNVVICEPDEPAEGEQDDGGDQAAGSGDQPAGSSGTSGGTTGSASGAGEDNAGAPTDNGEDAEQVDQGGASGGTGDDEGAGAGSGSTGDGTGEDIASGSAGGSGGESGTINPDEGPTSP